jgi:catechol 2,3-dioxygenase-like lactoylglutathione lyase family enzyme
MKKRVGDPWVSPPVYGRSLRGLGVNLLVRETERAVAFARDVLGLTIVYADPDLAVLRHGEQEWMLHADHTYDAHPLLPRTRIAAMRGGGVELRVHDVDPDAAVAAAQAGGFEVLEAAADKPHGLREAYLLDADGYVWVPDVPSRSKWNV